MRIAYVAHVNGGSESGVAAKLAGQVERWRRHGRIVRVFIVTRDEPSSWIARLGDAVVSRYGGGISRLRAFSAMVRAVRDFDPDLVYLRWDLFYPAMLRFPRRAPLVVEVNTDDLREYALGSRIRARHNALTRHLVLGRARALVFVTSELSRLPSFRRFAGVRRVITNGIDLAAYPELPRPMSSTPRLVFVGTSSQPWQGVDKLISLAGIRTDWHFDIVGERADGEHENVRWHGELKRAELLEVLARAQVGVGPLALHRKGMEEASPLKVREYLAVGLPIMVGYVDADTADLEEYTLRLPNAESNVIGQLDRIVEFVERARGLRVPRQEVEHLGTERKEEQRLALFDEIAQR